MLVNNINAKKFYESIKSVEGYIQLSGEPLKIYELNSTLPSWYDLHKNNNFILEAHFFKEDEKKSISIRQVNNTYKLFDRVLSDEELNNAIKYKAKTNKEVKIIQLWEEKEDQNCEDLKVLKPTIQLFAGFEKGNRNG